MCPHCLLAGCSAAVISIPFIPSAFRYVKSKFTRSEAAKANFDTLYGSPDMSRANPGWKDFQKGMGPDGK